MASKILIAALLASGALGRALPEGHEIANLEERELTLVSCGVHKSSLVSAFTMDPNLLVGSRW